MTTTLFIEVEGVTDLELRTESYRITEAIREVLRRKVTGIGWNKGEIGVHIGEHKRLNDDNAICPTCKIEFTTMGTTEFARPDLGSQQEAYCSHCRTFFKWVPSIFFWVPLGCTGIINEMP